MSKLLPAAFALLLLSACEECPSREYMPGQWHALEIAWVETYGMAGYELPDIGYVTGDDLDCASGHGWMSGKQCIGGYFWEYEIVVAWPDNNTLFSKTTFCHELYHASQFKLGLDWSHSAPGFEPNGAVSQCNAALRANGL